MPPFVIPPWSISYFEASSNWRKVGSNLDSNCNNLTMQLVHRGGLLTFVLPTPNLFDIHVLLKEPKGDWQALAKEGKKKLWCLLQLQRNLGYIISLGWNVKKWRNSLHQIHCLFNYEGEGHYFGGQNMTFLQNMLERLSNSRHATFEQETKRILCQPNMQSCKKWIHSYFQWNHMTIFE